MDHLHMKRTQCEVELVRANAYFQYQQYLAFPYFCRGRIMSFLDPLSGFGGTGFYYHTTHPHMRIKQG
jgi:hypothetical protein